RCSGTWRNNTLARLINEKCCFRRAAAIADNAVKPLTVTITQTKPNWSGSTERCIASNANMALTTRNGPIAHCPLAIVSPLRGTFHVSHTSHSLTLVRDTNSVITNSPSRTTPAHQPLAERGE